ncbi:MAG: DUF4111 domain-containing protein [Chloroflexi bacterium]|nr:DUF4111 domain-containing protein [Chloroflexota bacterium]
MVAILLDGARAALGADFVAMALDGSLATGDFSPNSDIDFLVVTETPVSEAQFASLSALHARIEASGVPFALDVEGSYIHRSALRRYDPADAIYPRLERGPGERLKWEEHLTDWVIHRYVLREKSVPVAGPPIRPMIDPVTPDELRQAVVALMRAWWAPMVQNPAKLEHLGYRGYAVVSMCRMLYTMREGDVVSKPAAARWLIAGEGAAWSDLIERALIYQLREDDLEAVLELMRYTAGIIC